MRSRTCLVRGCERPTRDFSRMCHAHRIATRRHGHPDQRAIRKCHLKPHAGIVRDWIDHRPDAWAHMEAAWADLVTEAKGIIAAYDAGKPGNRFVREAARQIVKVADDCDAKDAITTVAGVAYMWREDPYSFKSDRAFYYQTARRFVGLTERNVAKFFSYKDGRTKRVYRDMNPRATEWLGRRLVEKLGVYGVHIHNAAVRARMAREGHHQEAVRALQGDPEGTINATQRETEDA